MCSGSTFVWESNQQTMHVTYSSKYIQSLIATLIINLLITSLVSIYSLAQTANFLHASTVERVLKHVSRQVTTVCVAISTLITLESIAKKTYLVSISKYSSVKNGERILLKLKLEDVCQLGRKYCYDNVHRAIFTQNNI